MSGRQFGADAQDVTGAEGGGVLGKGGVGVRGRNRGVGEKVEGDGVPLGVGGVIEKDAAAGYAA